MDDNEIPCKIIPDAFWRKTPQNYFIWYMSKYNSEGVSVALRGNKGDYFIVFDPVAFPGASTSLEEQMQLEEIKWMMGE